MSRSGLSLQPREGHITNRMHDSEQGEYVEAARASGAGCGEQELGHKARLGSTCEDLDCGGIWTSPCKLQETAEVFK